MIKPGDHCFVKTTHPYPYLHGKMVECLSFESEAQSTRGVAEKDIWNVRFMGAPQLSDDMTLVQEGWIPERYLMPLRSGITFSTLMERMSELRRRVAWP